MKELAKAMLEVQKQMPVITKDSSGHRNQYLSLEKIVATMRPIMAANGLTVIQLPAQPTHIDNIALQTTVLHESGESFSQIGELPLTTETQSMNPSQAGGSAYTYLRRYAWSALLNIVTDPDLDSIAEPEERTIELAVQHNDAGVLARIADESEHYNHVNHVKSTLKKLGYSAWPANDPNQRLVMYGELAQYAEYRQSGMDGDAALDAVKNGEQRDLFEEAK